jgi:peptidoglycan/LPS O-acetylase OafA/YrhL
LPNQLPGRGAGFVFGMIAAELYATGRVAIWAHRLKFGLPGLLAGGIILMNSPLSHLIFGGIFFILLCLVLASDRVVNTVMSWPPLVGIGVMSYSLYLVHQPVVQVLAEVLRTRGHTTPNMTFFLLLLCIPFILLLAWGLFMGVERWTLTNRRPASTVWAVGSLRLSTARSGSHDPATGGRPAWAAPAEGPSS